MPVLMMVRADAGGLGHRPLHGDRQSDGFADALLKVTYSSPTSNGSTITGIGRAKATQIWYKALTGYMTSTTNYKGAHTATLNAAAALYGSGSTEGNAVNTTWAAGNVTA